MTTDPSTLSPRTPIWLTASAFGGIPWGLLGTLQFAASVTATKTTLVDSGLTLEHAAVMTGHPARMALAFAVAVFGGLGGSVLLLLRRAAAMPVLLTSFVACTRECNVA